MFYHAEAQFLLYSERFHFFRRPSIKGILHLVFYQPPTFPHFYSEMCNLMQVRDTGMIDWLICDWVRDLTVPMHLGLINGPFVLRVNLWDPCCFSKVPDCPQTYTLNVLWLQEGGVQIHMSEWSQTFHTHKECGQKFHPLLHTSYTLDCLTALLGEDVSSGYYVQ